MCVRYFILVLLIQFAYSRNVPRFEELDEEEQHLFRAAYDTPSYNQNDYEEEDLPVGKLDLVKDGLWAVKAKLKELKAFDKALAANLLSTKLKLKELLKDKLIQLKKPHHEEQPYYPASNYQAPQYSAPQHSAPHYGSPQYSAPQYAAPQYAAAVQHYQAAQQQQYAVPQQAYTAQHDPYYGH